MSSIRSQGVPLLGFLGLKAQTTQTAIQGKKKVLYASHPPSLRQLGFFLLILMLSYIMQVTRSWAFHRFGTFLISVFSQLWLHWREQTMFFWKTACPSYSLLKHCSLLSPLLYKKNGLVVRKYC